MIVKVQSFRQRTMLMILKRRHINVQYHFVRDMVEDNKVLSMKVDTLKNVTNSLTKSVSIEKLSWCKQRALLPWIVDLIKLEPLVYKENKKWENFGNVLYYYSLHGYLVFIGCTRGGRKGGQLPKNKMGCFCSNLAYFVFFDPL